MFGMVLCFLRSPQDVSVSFLNVYRMYQHVPEYDSGCYSDWLRSA
jgi:hypothetical protein